MTAPFQEPRPVVMGHRGAPLRAPENTPDSFAAAVAEGATWVELDVRLSADGVPVVRHDPDLPDGRLVSQCSAEVLREVGVWDLATVLATLPPSVGVDLEVKNLPGQPDYDPEQQVVERLAAVLGEQQPRPLLVSSFNPETVERAVQVLPTVPAGWLYGGNIAVDAVARVASEYGATVVCPHVDTEVGPAAVASLHAAGVAVLVWTVNDVERARELATVGVDALCTDEPGRICAALGR